MIYIYIYIYTAPHSAAECVYNNVSSTTVYDCILSDGHYSLYCIQCVFIVM